MGSVGSGNGVGVGVGSGSCRMQSPDGFSMEPGMKYSLTVFGQYGLALLPESLQMVIVSNPLGGSKSSGSSPSWILFMASCQM